MLTSSTIYPTSMSEVAVLRERGERAIDIADRPDNTFKVFSSYYPHGNINVPGWSSAATLEGMWQASKSIGVNPPGFVNDAFLNMANPTFREPRDGERLFGWRYGKEGRIINRNRANRVFFVNPFLEIVNTRCKLEVQALHELVAYIADNRLYVYDSSFVVRDDGHDDPAFILAQWFNSSVSYTH